MREISQLRLAQIGNFRPAHSTENDLRDALRRLGVTPMPFQEDEALDWETLTKQLRNNDFDLVLWTTTASFAAKIGTDRQYRMLDAARRADIPVIGYHLDRFVGLKARDETIEDRPFFSVDRLYTADGGHDREWLERGVNHTWMPPAISERWCKPGSVRPEYQYDVVFVGSWKHYHDDWAHRYELVQWASKTYGKRFMPFPTRGAPRITGTDLNDLYWSAKVVLGDSCLVPNPDGSPVTHYCSDRIPETLGRGGVLVHPSAIGIDGLFEKFFPYELGDFAGLKTLIGALIEGAKREPEQTEKMRLDSIEFIKANHTYTHRMRAVLADWGWGE